MPEAPEARTVADKLRLTLLNKIITSAYKGERASSLGFEKLKIPSTIIGVRSYGKKVLIDIEHAGNGCMIVVSLGMSGRLQYAQGNHSHIHLGIGEYQCLGSFQILRPAFALYFDDQRYMGHFNVIANDEVPIYFNNIGPDLLQAALDEKTYIPLEYWQHIFNIKKVKKWTLRKALIEQSLIAGIGNYLISEICYYSGLYPERIIETLTIEEIDRLRIVAHKILLLSYSYGGFTIESFISPDGEWGKYPAAVYGKKFDPYGNPVLATKAKDGRTSHWVPAIQH
ncbi:Formamidopyrimidine-DNA glycosylase [uncultured virus]|nr:Formamidopyrimidine-DNA glycosylase [uncultured virus]